MKSWIYGLIIFGGIISGSAAYCQPPQKINSNYQFKAAGADSGGIRVPIYSTLPVNPTANYVDDGAIAFQRSDSSLYQWHVTAHIWTKVGGGGSTVPGLPIQSVQWNSGNTFRGRASFIFDSAHSALHVDSAVTKMVNVFPDTLVREFMIVHTIDGDTATHGFGSNWTQFLNQTFTNPDGLRDAVVGFGWGVDGNGGPARAGQPGYSFNFENHFTPGAGAYNNEAHLPEVFYKNGTSTRLMSWTFNQDSVNGFNHLDLRFSDMNWGTPNRNRSMLVTDSSGKWLINTTGIGDNQPFIMHNNLTGNELLINNASTGLDMTFPGRFGFDAGNLGSFQFTNGLGGVVIRNANDNFLNPPFTVLSSGSIQRFVINGDGSGNFAGQFNIAGPLISSSSYTGIGAVSAIDPSAVLEAKSTTSGFLPPRMTTTQKLAIASPTEGLQVYDQTLHQMSYYNGTLWVNF